MFTKAEHDARIERLTKQYGQGVDSVAVDALVYADSLHAALEAEREAEREAWRSIPPHELVLHCPNCGKQHLDIGEFATRVHRKHKCENTTEGPNTGCGHLWVPFPYATKGVEETHAQKIEDLIRGWDEERNDWVARALVLERDRDAFKKIVDAAVLWYRAHSLVQSREAQGALENAVVEHLATLVNAQFSPALTQAIDTMIQETLSGPLGPPVVEEPATEGDGAEPTGKPCLLCGVYYGRHSSLCPNQVSP